LLQAGARIFEYQPTMLHTKTMVIDGVWATIGSTNFDNRSFSLNDEINVSFQAADLVKTLECHFMEDLGRAEEIKPAAWQKRGPLERAIDRFSNLLNPEL
jgi:cardiolipin synthase